MRCCEGKAIGSCDLWCIMGMLVLYAGDKISCCREIIELRAWFSLCFDNFVKSLMSSLLSLFQFFRRCFRLSFSNRFFHTASTQCTAVSIWRNVLSQV